MTIVSIIETFLDKIPYLYVALVLGMLYGLFLIWYESSKDGFDSLGIFDITFFSLGLSAAAIYLAVRLYEWVAIFHPNYALLYIDKLIFTLIVGILIFLGSVLYTAKRHKWSYFRIVDIYSYTLNVISVLFFGVFYFFTRNNTYLLVAAVSLALYFLVFRLRGYKFFSGILFSVFLNYVALVCYFIYPKDGYWILCTLLITISIVNIFFILKRTMVQKFTKETLEQIKKTLIEKKKAFTHEEDILHQEDPTVLEDRTVGDSEIIDEAILEESEKELIDIKIDEAESAKKQIDKAIKSIDSGKYGICEVCGKDIDPARLHAEPECTTCFDCSRKAETKQED